MQETSDICQKSQRDHLLNIAKHLCLLSAECTNVERKIFHSGKMQVNGDR